VCLDRDDPFIRVTGKFDKTREVGLGNRTREELTRFVRKYRAKEKGTDAYLFCTRRGDPLTEGTLFRVVKQLGQVARIKGVRCSPHTFRHSYAVIFMRSGGDIFRLSRLLGHSSVKITENYLRSFTQQDSRQGAVHPADQEDF
jgi:site-specific recombinase XerD